MAITREKAEKIFSKDQLSELRHVYESEGKIRAVRVTRDVTELGLADAKFIVEHLARKHDWRYA